MDSEELKIAELGRQFDAMILDLRDLNRRVGLLSEKLDLADSGDEWKRNADEGYGDSAA